jgi:hypothetical protein
MPIGPGKYDDTCTEVREKHRAAFVLLAIGAGDRGDGFSVQMEVRSGQPNIDARVAKLLRDVADQIEEAMVKN